MYEFLTTTASPRVLGGEILGLGNEPCQGFLLCLSDFPRAIALIILLEMGQQKYELAGEEKLTFSISTISFSA
jgi:hypothetical protein